MVSPRTALLIRRIIPPLLLVCATNSASAQEVTRRGVRYDLNRATVFFENEAIPPEQMAAFALLADQGIADIDRLLNHAEPGASEGPRITFVVRDSIPMSRSFRRTIMLPADRVRHETAPYLHETTHVLFPMGQECLWLSEGFASYVQSYVAESIGGYDGYVFSWGGNRNIDRLARRTLNSERGRALVAFVGSFEEPKNLFENRLEVAQPLYVLSHSLVKFMVDEAGLEKVAALVKSEDIAGSAPRLTGRSIEGWKKDWLARMERGAMPLTSGAVAPR